MKFKFLINFTLILSITAMTKVNAQSLTWLGIVSPNTASNAYDISDDGTKIVGNTGATGASRWTQSSGWNVLGVLPGHTGGSVARAGSSDGNVIVGVSSITQSGLSKIFRWTPGGGMQDIIPSLFNAQAFDVSDDGNVIVGNAGFYAGQSGFPLKWTISGGVEDLSSIIDSQAVVSGVNDDGSVLVGTIYNNVNERAYRLIGTTLEILDISGYTTMRAQGVSGDGTVTMGYALDSGGSYFAFKWDSTFQILGSMGSAGEVRRSNNDGSKIVGWFKPSSNDQRAFVWTSSNGLEDLNIKYSSLLQGNSKLNYAYSISGDGRYIVGWGFNSTTSRTEAYILDTQSSLQITEPTIASKFIAGETGLIKWTGGESGQTLKIEYSVNDGNTYTQIGTVQANVGQYSWKVPINTLTTKARIRITDLTNPSITTESQKFKIKPYLLTRIDQNGDYYEFRKNRDQWGFSNITQDMWPQTWWQQFNYQGTDPFTGSQYSAAFSGIGSANHSDWISWVNTFSVNSCYFNTNPGLYRNIATQNWRSTLGNWNGSCFGIAAANALEFRYPEQFQNKFPNFPQLSPPIVVSSDNGVKRVVNELFTHQYGKPSTTNDSFSANKTPFQTLTELKQMLVEDDATVRTLSIFNNGGPGGHTILAYGLEQDTVQTNLYYVKVYDNSNPNSNNPITIDILANNAQGTWSTPDWPGWGGNQGMYLEVPSLNYLNNASLNKSQNIQSPFILSTDELEINVNRTSSIQIIDDQNNFMGYDNGNVFNDIPGALPRLIKNGSEDPPYGYHLQTGNYSVVLNNFTSDTVNTFFFTGNKSFIYERYDATQTQTDNLEFDGGVAVTNSDGDNKTISLLNLISEDTHEKLFIARSLDFLSFTSIKIENPDSNTVKIISNELVDNYDVELNYVTENGIEIFQNYDIYLPANTSHIFVPEWTGLTYSDLKVLVDFENDGTIDDSLYFQNQATDVEDQGSLNTPSIYNLAQNFPNPFNPNTKISWQSPVGSHQTLMVYDVLGNEVATLVDEFRNAGSYEVDFNASNLSSGIYFYKLTAGAFTQTKKMTVLK